MMRPSPLIALCLSVFACKPEAPPPQAPPPEKKQEITFAAKPAMQHAAATGAAPSIADVAERAVKSVVNISTKKSIRQRARPGFDPFGPFGNPFGPFGPEQGPRQENSLGSGVIVSAEGVILTNNHVVEGAQEIRVKLADRREIEAEIKGTDPASDLAVLQLKGEIKDLEPLPIGQSSSMRLGDMVLAIGDPFGVGQTVTMGIISAKGRASVGIVDYEDFIQTDAAINPGNSGGALVNMSGELIGINTAILSRSGGSQGIGFAIPTDMARPIMEALLKDGRVSRGWLGVAIQDLTPPLVEALKLPVREGVLVSDVNPDTPADKAGIRQQDVILKVDGAEVYSSAQLRNRVAMAGAGKEVDLELLRDGEKKTMRVKLGELPSRGGMQAMPGGGAEPSVLSGIGVAPTGERGVVVESLDPHSPAAAAGLREGDVILDVNRRPVDSIQAFREAARSAETALLRVAREGVTMFLVVRK